MTGRRNSPTGNDGTGNFFPTQINDITTGTGRGDRADPKCTLH